MSYLLVISEKLKRISGKSTIFAQKNKLMFLTAIQDFVEQKQYPVFSPRAVFFDMDGVLFDSMKFHARAWVQALRDVGIPFTEYEAYMNEGRTGHSTIDGAYNNIYQRNATEQEKQNIYGLKTSYFETYGPSPVMPYARELLRLIKSQGLQIFVVTGSGQASLIDNLQLHFPGIFQKEKMVTAFDVKKGKPHPEPYLMALAKAGLNPWEALVVENAPLGVESAVGAGIFTIGVNTGPLPAEVLSRPGASVVLESMKDLYDKWTDFSSLWLNK